MSADGQRMIGHMILRKNIDGEDILGLKIVGGITMPSSSSSRKGAIIEKVKRGSIAEQEGHLRVGKNHMTSFSFFLNFFFILFSHHQKKKKFVLYYKFVSHCDICDCNSLFLCFYKHKFFLYFFIYILFLCSSYIHLHNMKAMK